MRNPSKFFKSPKNCKKKSIKTKKSENRGGKVPRNTFAFCAPPPWNKHRWMQLKNYLRISNTLIHGSTKNIECMAWIPAIPPYFHKEENQEPVDTLRARGMFCHPDAKCKMQHDGGKAYMLLCRALHSTAAPRGPTPLACTSKTCGAGEGTHTILDILLNSYQLKNPLGGPASGALFPSPRKKISLC